MPTRSRSGVPALRARAGVVTAGDMLVILGVAVINALIGFIQENNAEKSLKSIQNMLSSEALVLRSGQQVTVGTDEIVPGDIVLLRPGDKIPADLRLIDVHNLRDLRARRLAATMPVLPCR